jgi:tetratricopeptide (TPR) repeat protein
MCTIMSSQQYFSIEQNNFAASLIEAGHFAAAIQALSIALKRIHKEGRDTAKAEISHLSEPFQTSLDDCMNLEGTRVIMHQDSERDESDRYIYRHPIRIPLNSGSYTRGGSAAMALPAIVIFNLALAYQLLSESTERNQKFLSRAAQFYELVLNLLGRDARFESSIFFSMAIMNNLGAIHHSLNEREASKQYFQDLFSNLTLVSARKIRICEIVDGFLRNVFAADGHLYAAAPAA